MDKKEKYMALALRQAQLGKEKDEVPVGCVIVKGDEVIAKSYNHKERKLDPTSHAEIECIKKATKKLGQWQLNECEMYVTLEPCIMCSGAIIQSRISKVYIGTKDPKGGAFGSNINVKKIKGLNHYPDSEAGILQKECSDILKEYFKSKRK